jgi:hypothetical protein
LTRPIKGCPGSRLGDADRQARRHSQGKVALARKLAVILHRMLANNVPFNPGAKAAKL